MYLILLALFACDLPVASETTPELTQVSPELRAGRALYRESCQGCHGLAGDGDGPAAAALKPPRLDQTELSVERLTATITSGIPKTAMEPSGLDKDEISALITYLGSLQGGPLQDLGKGPSD